MRPITLIEICYIKISGADERERSLAGMLTGSARSRACSAHNRSQSQAPCYWDAQFRSSAAQTNRPNTG